jgi:hypothetical protein
MTDIWHQISRDEFFSTVGKMNVHPQIQPPEKYPYISLWKTPMGQVTGKTVGQYNGECQYYVPKITTSPEGNRNDKLSL